MKEIDRLVNLLFPAGGSEPEVLDIKFFAGEEMVTVEEFCSDVHSAFVQIDSGRSKPCKHFEETSTSVHINRFLGIH